MTIKNATEAKDLYTKIIQDSSVFVIEEILAALESYIKRGNSSYTYTFTKELKPFTNAVVALLKDKGFKVSFNEDYSDFGKDCLPSLTIKFE